MADTHKYVGNHPHDFNGRMLAPGDTFTPDKEQLEHYEMKELVENGTVISLVEKAGGGDNK